MINNTFAFTFRRKALPLLSTFALAALFAWSAFPSLAVRADVSDSTITAATGGATVYSQNGGSVVQNFSPELGSTIDANATSSATAYYGIRIVNASSTPDTHWLIMVDNASSALAPSDVTITQKGYFNASTSSVGDSAYTAAQSGSDLSFTSGSFSLNAGDDTTDVDAISFSPSAPLGTYTVTRTLVDASGTPMSNQFVITTDLEAAASSTASTTPVIAPHDDVTATATSSNGVIVNYTLPTVNDSLDASTTASCVPSSGSLFSLGTTTVMCNATDSFGNSASSTSFNVIVNMTSSSTATTTASSTGSTASTTVGISGPNPNIPPAPFSGGGGGIPSLIAAGLLSPVMTTTNSGTVVNTTVQPSIGLAFGVGIFKFTRALSPGMQGDDVVELQTRLQEMQLFAGPITGYYGPLTTRAVARFQASLHIPQTGSLDLETLAVLNNG